MTLYKALDGYQATHGGTYRYPGVGRWTRHLDPDRVQACEYGYHLARDSQVLGWLAPTLFVAEACPDHPVIDAGDKVVTCRVRLTERLDSWNEVTARLFAADCAEAALLGERACGWEPDERSWRVVEAARRFARGEISREELDAARAATWNAVRAATWNAAWAAARNAAWAASRERQYDRLCLYLNGDPLPPVEPLYGEESSDDR